MAASWRPDDPGLTTVGVLTTAGTVRPALPVLLSRLPSGPPVVANPVTVIYFGALVLAGQGTTPLGHWDASAFVVAAFAASASWQLLLAVGGAVLGRALTGPHGRLLTALVSSAVILVLAARLLLSAPRG